MNTLRASCKWNDEFLYQIFADKVLNSCIIWHTCIAQKDSKLCLPSWKSAMKWRRVSPKEEQSLLWNPRLSHMECHFLTIFSKFAFEFCRLWVHCVLPFLLSNVFNDLSGVLECFYLLKNWNTSKADEYSFCMSVYGSEVSWMRIVWQMFFNLDSWSSCECVWLTMLVFLFMTKNEKEWYPFKYTSCPDKVCVLYVSA